MPTTAVCGTTPHGSEVVPLHNDITRHVPVQLFKVLVSLRLQCRALTPYPNSAGQGRAGLGRAGQDSQGLQRGTVRGTYLCQNVSTFDPTATHPKSIRLSVLLEIEASVPTL